MKYRFIFSLLFLIGCSNGDQGERGPRGYPGSPGGSCTVAYAVNGSVITCDDGTTTVITNGLDGADGQDSTPTAYSIVDMIKPCPGIGSEVLLRLQNGSLLAHYSHGSRQYLTVLTPGTYQLTDGSSCNFTVHNDLSVTW